MIPLLGEVVWELQLVALPPSCHVGAPVGVVFTDETPAIKAVKVIGCPTVGAAWAV